LPKSREIIECINAIYHSINIIKWIDSMKMSYTARAEIPAGCAEATKSNHLGSRRVNRRRVGWEIDWRIDDGNSGIQRRDYRLDSGGSDQTASARRLVGLKPTG
jgi:hypothetical protein